MNGNDLLEYTENNYEVLLEDFLDNRGNKQLLANWLDSEGYELFLQSIEPRWYDHIEEEYNNSRSYEENEVEE
jgi:hypothetical protein